MDGFIGMGGGGLYGWSLGAILVPQIPTKIKSPLRTAFPKILQKQKRGHRICRK